jgi:cellulose synthase operon protein C
MNRSAFFRPCSFVSSLALAGALLGGVACGGSARSPATQEKWSEVRRAESSDNPERVTSWMISEMLRPGGNAKAMHKARARLDALAVQSVMASLARGMHDAAYGQSSSAADHFFDALLQARTWDDPAAPLYAWYAALRAQELSPWSKDFAQRHRKQVDALLTEPGGIGFRAYGIVVDFWADDAFTKAEHDIEAKLGKKLGCIEQVSLAGPFGSNNHTDMLRSFAAERAGVWPARFEREEGQVREPHLLAVDAAGCAILADEPVSDGIFYAQSFLELKTPSQLILTAGGASQMWVNDKLVLTRDLRQWGSWPKIATMVQLGAGRHRILWKTRDAQTSLRVLQPNGMPLSATASTDQYAGYSLVPPTLLPDPNELSPFLNPAAKAVDSSELTRFIAAYLVDDDGAPEVAAVLFEPFVKKVDQATGLSLSTAATYVQGDPIYDESQTRDLAHELQVRAVEQDPKLWFPKYQNIVWEAEQKAPRPSSTSSHAWPPNSPRCPASRSRSPNCTKNSAGARSTKPPLYCSSNAFRTTKKRSSWRLTTTRAKAT